MNFSTYKYMVICVSKGKRQNNIRRCKGAFLVDKNLSHNSVSEMKSLASRNKGMIKNCKAWIKKCKAWLYKVKYKQIALTHQGKTRE